VDDAERAVMVWRALGDAFGKDALARKYGATPPDSWSHELSRLREFELDRGLRRVMRSGGDSVPSLPKFLRLCRAVEDEADHHGTPQPTVVQNLHPEMDAWDVASNFHLLHYITQQGALGIYYLDGRTDALVECKKVWAATMRELQGEQNLPADAGRGLWADSMRNAELMLAQRDRRTA
jgi:hypothetical protein